MPVLAFIDDIGTLPIQFDEILIAIPSAQGDVMRRIVDLCEKTGKRFRTIPKIDELIEGRISMNTIREVTLEDLIGRAGGEPGPGRGFSNSSEASGSW